MFKSNCHTHTLYCDGKNRAEEMVLAAINLGFKSLGFSGHSPMKIPNDWVMRTEKLENYYDEIASLQEKYKDKIEILLGMELDSLYDVPDKSRLDYTIGSVHEIVISDNEFYDIDNTAEILDACCRKKFSGDYVKLSKHYYKQVSDFVISEKPDVVGHFDLIEKFNENKALFDYDDPNYRSVALNAIDKILEHCPDIIFEVNTGAMFRCGNSEPYPRFFILKHLADRNAKITITSDAHSTDSLDFAFDKAEEVCKKAGFKEVYMLRKNGFEKISLY